MDIYELLGEDPGASGHRHARSLVAADRALSTVRRYAKAVGALIRHEVVPVDEHDVRLTAHGAGMPDYRWDSSSTEAARRASGDKLVGA